MSTIMVQVTDHKQTLAAIHFACTMARSTQQRIVLLKLIPVNHPGWLGTEFEYLNLTDKDLEALRGYEKIAESYGVAVEPRLLPVVSALEGIINAADSVDAQIVFAHAPHSLIPFWQAWQTRVLRWSLKQHQRELYVLDYQGSLLDWKPSPSLPVFVDTASNN